MVNQTDRIMTVSEVAEYVAMSASTLNKLRLFGGGPRYLKLGRSVRYRASDVDAWISSRVAENTASYSARKAG